LPRPAARDVLPGFWAGKEHAMHNYDAWLEKPYDEQARYEERFTEYWDNFATDILAVVRDKVLESVPRGDLGYLRDQFNHILDDMSEEVLMRWAHEIEPGKIPLYADWRDDPD
jgi:hypothetical protein